MIIEWRRSKNEMKKYTEPMVNSHLLLLPPYTVAVDFPNQATSRPRRFSLESCRFRLEHSTILIRNRSNTRTRIWTGSDRAKLWVIRAEAICVGEESKNAGRRHIRIRNDYHPGNARGVEELTPAGVGNFVESILICRATGRVILLQDNRGWLEVSGELAHFDFVEFPNARFVRRWLT